MFLSFTWKAGLLQFAHVNSSNSVSDAASAMWLFVDTLDVLLRMLCSTKLLMQTDAVIAVIVFKVIA